MVLRTFPGRDHKVRDVLVRTQDGELRRAVAKLILLYRPEDNDQQGVENVEENSNH